MESVSYTPKRGSCTPRRESHIFTPREDSNTDAPSVIVASQSGIREKRILHKSIFDRVYGHIQFPPVVSLFIDSAQVQRLRDLKQLGNTHYVYPGGTNTRFEHSLGVSHLAMEFLKQIIANHTEQRDMGICELNSLIRSQYHKDTAVPELEKDICCVGIAGLCHDLGHGPLSHVFEQYVNRMPGPKWSHEDSSIAMLRDIWSQRSEVLESLEYDEKDLRFVELCIRGLKPGDRWPQDVGRDPWKRFMTDIVANKRSGLDVDKLDYLQRDSMCCLGAPALVAVRRLFQGTCVMTANNETQICYQEKLDGTIEEVFHARARQHRLLYQHRVVKVTDLMTLDAFMKADAHFKIHHDGVDYSLSEAVSFPEVYVQTGDWVINAILHSTEEELQPARSILEDIQNRALYKSLGTYRFSWSQKSDVERSAPSTAYFSAKDFTERVCSHRKWKAEIESWESEHGLPAFEVVTAVIQEAASDMDTKSNPLSQIRFFDPRSKMKPMDCHAHTLGHYTTDTSCVPRIDRVYTVVSRMPCTEWQSKKLREYSDNYYESIKRSTEGEHINTSPVRSSQSINKGAANGASSDSSDSYEAPHPQFSTPFRKRARQHTPTPERLDLSDEEPTIC